MLRSWLAAACVSSLVISACAADSGDAEDGELDAATGKADSPAEGSADAKAILALVNDIGVSEEDLDYEIGLSSRVAAAIVAHRDGADREPGTADDDRFETLTELDTIPYLGPIAMDALLKYALAAPGTTLTIRLVGEEYVPAMQKYVTLPLSSLNADMAQYGISFPATLTLGPRDGAAFKKVLDDLATASEKLGRNLDLDHTWDPSEYGGCYSGAVTGVPATIEALRESVFSIYMGIQAERWGTHKTFYYSGAGGDTEADWLEAQAADHPDEVALWKSYNTSSTTYLMMVDGGQQGDGTELFAVPIPSCN